MTLTISQICCHTMYRHIYIRFWGLKNHIFCVPPSRMDILRRIYAAADLPTRSELRDSSFPISKRHNFSEISPNPFILYTFPKGFGENSLKLGIF